MGRRNLSVSERGAHSDGWYKRRLAYGRGLLGLARFNLAVRELYDYPGYRTAYDAGARRRVRDQLAVAQVTTGQASFVLD